MNNDFTTVGLTRKIPIFQKAQYARTKLSNIEVNDQKNELQRIRIEIMAEDTQREKSLAIIQSTIKLNKSNIQSIPVIWILY